MSAALDLVPALARHEADPTALQLYEWMQTARCIDEAEQGLVARGEAFFQVSGSGHEASAALASALLPGDYLHCHYRDKALMLARGLPVAEFFDSLLGNSAGHSAGRQMSAHLSSPAHHILSLPGPVGNNALQAVGIAQEIQNRPARPIVLCAIGDGTTQQGEVLEAIAEAVRSRLPVLFLVHDNRWAISTPTAGRTFFSQPDGDADTFYGLPIHRVDGRDALACQAAFTRLVASMRCGCGPALCVMSVDRLCSHTNADDDTAYRDPAVTAGLWRSGDPVCHLRMALLHKGCSSDALDRLDAQIRCDVGDAVDQALRENRRPAANADGNCNSYPPAPALVARPEYTGALHDGELTMAAALRDTLHARMGADARVTLYGQDIEDPKGDVFGVTRGLSSAFPGRVNNAPLSESTIIGTSIGRALAGGRPVAFLQFADFLPLAFNQLAAELASMDWRTCGGWRAPVIVLAAGGGYRPGLGPFHSHSFESVMAHLPGIDVALPASAGDAAGLLNAAFHSERPTVIFYPKALLHDRTRATSPDVGDHFVPRAKARMLRSGEALTFVAWGNTVALCTRAADLLAQAGHACDVIDLRWLAPWDRALVIASARKTGRLVVVHEDNLSAGFGAEVLATVSEALPRQVDCRRVARADEFIPSRFDQQLALLPSYRRVVEAACEMLSLDVLWEAPAPASLGEQVVPVFGASPTDHTVEIAELNVAIGERVEAGQVIACVEADKAAAELASPAAGIVQAVHVEVGERVAVGSPLLTLTTDEAAARSAHGGPSDLARIVARSRPLHDLAVDAPTVSKVDVRLLGLGVVRGRRKLGNDELAAHLPDLCGHDKRVDEIYERTGIRSRCVADASQNVVSMATEAAALALREAGITAADLALVICSTSTPRQIAPSTACEVLAALALGAVVPAYDLAAACSGYLYALANAWDFLQQQPRAHVLVITSEVMRSVVRIDDPAASPVFGDAATATVLSGEGGGVTTLGRLLRPVLGAIGADGSVMRLPFGAAGEPMQMNATKVYSESVRRMSATLGQACAQAGLRVTDLAMVVPQQASGRVIEALRQRLRLSRDKVWNEVCDQGNTSSSSIPMALDTVLRQPRDGGFLGLCAFGGGLTFAGAVIEVASRHSARTPTAVPEQEL